MNLKSRLKPTSRLDVHRRYRYCNCRISRALTDTKPHVTDCRELGPGLLAKTSHDCKHCALLQVAAKLRSGLRREAVHVKLSEEQSVQRFRQLACRNTMRSCFPPMDLQMMRKKGRGDAVKTVTGRPPQKFDAWVQKNKTAWQ